MPRRLGDDPLARARSERTKATDASAPVAPGSEAQQGTTQIGIRPSSRASYNDVFFQRRAEGIAAQQVADTLRAPETPEISEISEIPEIREVAAASGNQDALDVTIGAKTASDAAQDTQAAPAPPFPIIEETAARSNSDISDTAPAMGAVPEAMGEPVTSPASSEAPSNGGEPKPEPQKSGGFFKRLFGKFK